MAAAASVAGAKKLREKGVIAEDEEVICILTGNLMKDSDTTVKYHLGSLEGIDARLSNKPTQVEPNLDSIEALLRTTNSSPVLEMKTLGV